ncbi:glycosyltransferase family 4 protein [Candidatus Palauibacter sp.]|uniref:glycosyltransferase family 4 protein n=1 Tax=Candidatus Palauibacter sp. TaxID=3101350 RepID=UPI003B59FB40
MHVVTAFPRHDADIITPWLGRLLLGLRDRGVDVEVLAPAYRGGGATEWRGIPVRRFRYAPSRLETLTHDETAPDRLRSHPASLALLPGYMVGGSLASIQAGTGEPPDVVHVHWPVPHAWFGGMLRASSGGRTALVSSFYSVEIRWIERRVGWAIPFLRWAIETSDVVTAISSATASAVARYTRREVPVIPFSAAVSVDRAARTPAEVSAPGSTEGSTSRRGGPFQLLFVGRLVERKGVDVLIRALARVRERLDATLTVVGEGRLAGPLRAEAVRAGVSEFVRFTGRVDDRALVEAYETSDAFVLPAVIDRKGDTEGLGVVLLEALEFGLPVIASGVGGIPDIVRHGETGLLVPPGDPAALARAVLDVAEKPGVARRRVEQGQAHARERFGLSGVVDRLLTCYETAIATRGGRAAGETENVTLAVPGRKV